MLFEHVFKVYTLNTSNKPRVIYTALYDESTADQPDYFAYAFVRENVAHGYDVVTTL